MITIQSNQIRPGDVVLYHGTRHAITHVRRLPNGSWPIATDGTGWAIALGEAQIAVCRQRNASTHVGS